MTQTQGKVVQLTNGDLAVTLDDDILAQADLKLGDKVIWNPKRMGFKKFEGFNLRFPLSDSEVQVSCPPKALPWKHDTNWVQITLRLHDTQISNVITREAFELFVNGLVDMNQELKYISEIISVEG